MLERASLFRSGKQDTGPEGFPPFLLGGGALHGLYRRYSLSPHRRAFALLDAAVEGGCTMFDTAAVYGGGYADRVIGDFVRARGLRDRIVLLGKGGHPDGAGVRRVHPAFVAKDLEASLRLLRMEFIDLYMLHRDDPELPVSVIMEGLHRFVQAGKVRALGASNWSHRRIEEANQYAEACGLTPFTASSPHFSLAEMHAPPWPGCTTITGQDQADARRWYTETGMPVLAWSPLAGGLLAGRATLSDEHTRAFHSEANERRRKRALELAKKHEVPLAHVALAYARQQPFPVHPIVSASTPERLRSLLEAARLRLSPEEIASLEAPSPIRTREESCPSPS